MQEGAAKPSGCGVAIVDNTTTAYLDLRGVLDSAKEVEKLRKKQADVRLARPALHNSISPAVARNLLLCVLPPHAMYCDAWWRCILMCNVRGFIDGHIDASFHG